MWQTFHHDEKLHARRHKDRTLVGGAIFVKVSGYFPGVTVDHVAHCYMNFNDRAGWDRQMDGFKVTSPVVHLMIACYSFYYILYIYICVCVCVLILFLRLYLIMCVQCT